MPTPHLPPGFDFTDPDLYAERLPVDELAHIRDVSPIWWNDQPIGAGGFHDGGYWVITKHKDVKNVSLQNAAYSSVTKTAIPEVISMIRIERIKTFMCRNAQRDRLMARLSDRSIAHRSGHTSHRRQPSAL